MANSDLLEQILGSVMGGTGGAGAGGPGAGLGGILGGMLGGNDAQVRSSGTGGRGPALGGQGGALVAMLLPLAMQWVQRNGGIGGVLQRFQQKGYSQQAASWVGTGDNEAVGSDAIEHVVGTEELSRLSQQLGASHEEVASGLAQILPGMVNHLTPQGAVPHDADDRLGRGMDVLQRFLAGGQAG